jgi:hypothetical protein
MADNLNQKLAKSIELADRVTDSTKGLTLPIPFNQECGEIKSKTTNLSALLRKAATATSELYLQCLMHLIIE